MESVLLELCLVCLVSSYRHQNVVNVALHKLANQSTTHDVFKHPGSAAVDGKKTPDQRQNSEFETCIHTSEKSRDKSPWWEVDLGQPYPVVCITIHARPNFLTRMRATTITIDNRECFTISAVPTAIPFDVTCTRPLTGQKVRLTRKSSTADFSLNICEVEVWVCDYGNYGRDCSQSCGHCHKNETCNKETGTCPRSTCAPGWQGDFCRQPCDDGKYGRKCSQSCGHCYNKETCNKETGTCPSSTCAPGWQGDFCRQPCDDGKYGRKCSQSCGHCYNKETCNKETGTCPSSTYAPGWQGDFCRQPCDDGKYGSDCSQSCGHCYNNETCNKETGTCQRGTCAPGWQGDLCKQHCNGGKYGQSCAFSCGHCNDVGACDKMTGRCLTGCTAGWKGELCDTICNDGEYGGNCSQSCGNCYNGTCEKATGRCPSGACAPGWKGDSCQEKLVPKDTGVISSFVGVASTVIVIVLIIAAVIVLFLVNIRRRLQQKPDHNASPAHLNTADECPAPEVH